jgi:polysaccharide pyruvyl transferase WcaK-like protein
MQIVVLGYYQRNNLGDTIYTLTMPRLFPECQLSFYNLDDLTTIPTGTDAIVCGGGDLINRYFHDKIVTLCKGFSGRKIALSIGISFESFRNAECLNLFDQIFLRNKTDVRYLQSKLGSEVVHYLPDLAFSLDTTGLRTKHWSKFTAPIASRRPRLGLFYIASVTPIKPLVNQLIELTGKLSQVYDVRLYRFNTSHQVNEDDDLLNQAIAAALPNTYLKVKSKVYSVPDMLKVFGRLDLAICMRYHAHVLATLTGTPFISLSTTRKTELFMLESGLQSLLHRVIGNLNGEPTTFDVDGVVTQLNSIWMQRTTVRSNLLTLAADNRALLITSKPQAVLTSFRPSRIQLSRSRSLDQLYTQVRAFILAQTGYDVATRVTPDQAWEPAVIRRIAEHMSFLVTESPISEFIHGTIQNLTERPFELMGMLDYMLKHYRPRRGKFNLTYINQNITPGLHRSGWQYVVDALMALNDPSGVILDTYVDRTFHWAEETLHHHGVIPYTSPWVGIVHHTPLIEYSEYNTVTMLQKPTFRQSLPMCRGFYVLSPTLATWLRQTLTELGWGQIHIEVLVHPTEFVSNVFTIDNYIHNPSKKLVQIGAWLRNTFTIYEVKLDPSKAIHKYALKGRHMDNYLIPDSFTLKYKKGEWIYTSHDQTQIIDICRSPAIADRAIDVCRSPGLNKWVSGFLQYLSARQITFRKMTYNANHTPKVKIIGSSVPSAASSVLMNSSGSSNPDKALAHSIEAMINSVTIQSTLSNYEYDRWLSENIVFLNLIDCSAVNTVIECIVRNTPIVINRIPQTVQLLGETYPLFYTSADQVNSLLTLDQITAATNYLKNLDKEPYRIETFIRTIKSGAIYQSIDV